MYFKIIIVIYATSFCVNWAFLIVRGTILKHERSEGFKSWRAIRKAQFTQKRVAYKILLFETTSLKLPNHLPTDVPLVYRSAFAQIFPRSQPMKKSNTSTSMYYYCCYCYYYYYISLFLSTAADRSRFLYYDHYQ
jgi:hypothetical protein